MALKRFKTLQTLRQHYRMLKRMQVWRKRETYAKIMHLLAVSIPTE